jgi:dUTP pyrophosphatase|tara:strand:- start:334 stop:795 length:462 start_codon:yes stop_codon:yes gene_type:complete
MKVLIKVAWDGNADRSIPLPTFQSTGSAGADVHANFGTNQTAVTILPGDRLLIPTGFSVEIPRDYEIQIRPRSGLAIKYGITLLNSPGTIDSDYRGLVGIILINNGQDAYTVSHGDRIAQLIVSPVIQAVFQTIDNLSETTRGTSGFGSTGKN